MLIYGFPSRYQTRHNFVGESVFFLWKSVSIRILRQCTDVLQHFSRDSYRDAVCKQNRDIKNWSRRNWSFTSRGATVAPRSITLHRRRNLPFFGNLADKASCVDDKTVVSLHILNNNFVFELCSDTAVSSQKRQQSVLDTENPYYIDADRLRCRVEVVGVEYDSAFLPGLSAATAYARCYNLIEHW